MYRPEVYNDYHGYMIEKSKLPSTALFDSLGAKGGRHNNITAEGCRELILLSLDTSAALLELFEFAMYGSCLMNLLLPVCCRAPLIL